MWARARHRVNELLTEYERPEIASDGERELLEFAYYHAKKVGLDRLPGVEQGYSVPTV
jgi:hypothetical protein